jgi:hypothetical protein
MKTIGQVLEPAERANAAWVAAGTMISNGASAAMRQRPSSLITAKTCRTT